MNSLTIFLILVIASIVIICSFLIIWLLRSWRDLPRRARWEYRKEVYSHSSTFMILFVILLLPLLIILDMALNFYPILFGTLGALLGAGSVIGFWENRALPLSGSTWEDEEPAPRPYIPGPIIIPPSPLAPVPIPQVTGSDLVHRSFNWTYSSKKIRQVIEMDISNGRYQQYRQEVRLPVEEWTTYATTEMPEIRVLAIHFQNLHLQRDWCTIEQASNILSFTQECIPYSYDEETTDYAEWPRYPIESLMDETGDCEDVSILAGAVLARLGFQVALLEYPGHVALGIAGADGIPGNYVNDRERGKRYFYAEATAKGWHIGETPAEYKGILPRRIMPVEILIDK
jgi:hypothetical protein